MVKGEIYKDIRGVVKLEHSALIIWDVPINMLAVFLFNTISESSGLIVSSNILLSISLNSFI